MAEMKDSGIEWIGEIPVNWKVKKGKYFIQYIERAIRDDDDVITCFRDGEVTLRSNRREEGFTVSEKEIGYQGINEGDLIVHGMDGFAGAIGISDSKGKASPVLNVLEPNGNKRFYMYYLRNMAYGNVFLALSTGIRVRTCDTNWKKLRELPYVVPPMDIQNEIANYLYKKCAEIDALYVDIKKQIETLEEYKKSVITEAVTKGLEPDVELKDSGNQYWEIIPSNWNLIDIKYLFEIVKRIAGKEGFDILSVTQKGLRIKDISKNEGQIAESYANYQFVYPTYYVMNHMDLLTGWVDCSEYFGVTSPDYRVFRLRDKRNSLSYYKYIMQVCYMNKIFYSLGQGVSNLGRWRLQTESFNNFQVPVPPTEEQIEIAKHIDEFCVEIDGAIADKKQQLEILEEYKKSLIYEYVTGKKEVPDNE
ncbi:MAG: restriction endonuclease subunit S [Anaerovibrio sp.]